MAAMPSVAAAEQSASRPGEQLAKFTPSRVTWAATSCVLQMGFGSAEDPLLVQLERFSPDDDFLVTLMGNRLKRWNRGQPFTVRFGPALPAKHIANYMITSDQDGTPTIIVNMSLAPAPSQGRPTEPVTAQMEASVTSATLTQGDRAWQLNTGPLGPAFAQLRKCSDQLADGWGVDLAQLRIAAQRARPSTYSGNWITTADIPTIVALRGDQAFIHFRLTVGIDGNPSGCAVVGSLRSKAFDEQTCQLLMRRARFHPARNAQGAPIPDYYIGRVRWLP